MPGADRRRARKSGTGGSTRERIMPINVWDYLREYDELREEILATVDRVFRSGRLILGQEGVKFEREMAAYLGVSGPIALNSRTHALHIALAPLALHTGPPVLPVPPPPPPTTPAPPPLRP